jgi:hypothetical protein
MMRNLTELENNALKFWPSHISEKEKQASIIPKLIETQDQFLSILKIAVKSPLAWKEVLDASEVMSSNLFLKHLNVLTDIGGENLKRYRTELPKIIKGPVDFIFNGKTHKYNFLSLKEKGNWSNPKLHVDGPGLTSSHEMSQAMLDVCMLLIFGSSITDHQLPPDIEDKCIIGTLLGKDDELEKFVKERYIWVSKITGGATANTLGQITESYVADYLKSNLPGWKINEDQLPEASQNDTTSLSVDVVTKSPTGKYVAIEVSFQVTTNSVIERKAGQAIARQELLHQVGHRIAYILDGAGNFERQSALRTICEFSDCSVTLKDQELDILVQFIKDFEEEI